MPRIDQMNPDVSLWNGGLRVRENVLGRQGRFDDIANALATGVMTSVGVALYAGDFVSKITVVTGTTAVSLPTNQWAALYTPGGLLMTGSQSADGLTGAIAASSPLTFTLTVPQLIQTEGIYYAGVMIKATTVPSLMCSQATVAAMCDVVVTGQVVRAQTSGSALTTTAPATIASPTTVSRVAYVVLS